MQRRKSYLKRKPYKRKTGGPKFRLPGGYQGGKEKEFESTDPIAFGAMIMQGVRRMMYEAKKRKIAKSDGDRVIKPLEEI